MSDGPHRRAFEIDGRVIDDSSPCYVIAEVGHNHQGELEQAKRLFDAAKDCGADAVKLQKRDNRSLFTKEYYSRPYDNPNSFGTMSLDSGPRRTMVLSSSVIFICWP